MSLRSRRYRFYGVKEAVRLLGRAVTRHNMIEAGDRVLVAYSGGADSGVMLRLLKDRLKWIPIDYELKAVHLDQGFEGAPTHEIKAYLEAHGVDHRVLRREIGPPAHSSQNPENPCFMCARLRRKALFEAARDLGCNKLALGHNLDDIIETFFLNVFFNSQADTMLPVQALFGGSLAIIRPLFLLDSDKVRVAARKLNIPDFPNPCPTAKKGERAKVREFLKTLYRGNKKVRGNVFRALTRMNPGLAPPGD